ncbi:hypothetical protein BU26DRAFT_564289 [Trematosphaeria pertusa]|uniref:Uncharacterized protein n=1 Tax=Trematosphaeria pertusa TaxID=390896 RepID=A0A6A6IJN8_9PLEO|nr:uncharacterized protein BU26DRAFT_564289 [Trematosphaeria pertusa]KAF2250439.1 hypothetical protein BU26DRAFT_564289 [Trematosphaeria pertusa]
MQCLKAARRVREEDERLKSGLRKLEAYERSYTKQYHEYVQQQGKLADNVASEFTEVYFLRGWEISQAVTEAEKGLEEARKLAKNAGVPNADDQESEFASVPGEGYDDEYHEACIDSCDRGLVEGWLRRND